jgi:glyoxylase-like metal-dependent hydrolase (beta-lactamase superfamily II)
MFHRDVAEGVHRIGEHYLNFYLIEEGGHITIVDAGLPASWGSLLEALSSIGSTPADVEALVLTHAHFDHIGFAERARSSTFPCGYTRTTRRWPDAPSST